ncbi:MAG TPA: pyridoxal-dependent decarboxylase [Gemmatimonadaceae bacterium]|nr:pyridoxal-dependent decarboxylase [Gemmatimonadaceae bacterium]
MRLSDRDELSFEWAASAIEDALSAWWERVRSVPPSPVVDRAELESSVGEYRFDKPINLRQLVGDVVHLLETSSVHAVHPRYFGLFVPSVHPASVAADALVAGYNPQVGAWWHSPSANEIERHTLKYLASCLGIAHMTGQFTSGGNEANHTTVLAALAHHFPEYIDGGLRSLGSTPVLYASSESHHSLVKIARHAGLGAKSFRTVQVDELYRMRTRELADAIENDLQAGHRPFLVVATLGTTGCGAIDPIAEIAEICRRHNIWLHVDGAYGASVCLSPKLRHLVEGVELADSVTWDAHKWMSVSMGAGMFFTKHTAALRTAFDVDASYVLEETAERMDLYQTSLQWSRRFIGLKVFMTLASLGAKRVADDIEWQTQMGVELRRKLVEAGWTIVNDSPLPVVCFTHSRFIEHGTDVENFAARMRDEGNVWISSLELGGARVLRACITSYRTTTADLDVLINSLG